MKNNFVSLILLLLVFPPFASPQDPLTNELRYEVNRNYPYISITREKLEEAHTIADLNQYYKPSWVREYISVEILTSDEGKIRKAVSENDTLSQEQKDIMDRADSGADISVRVQYIPENTLKHNDAKEFDFIFTVEPESDAQYPGGQQQLRQYLKEKAIDGIPAGSFQNYDFTIIAFTVNEEGEIVNVHIFGSEYPTSVDKKIQEQLLEAIRSMPCWTPAEYADGTKVKQEFALTVGNHENCVIHTLNIRLD